MHSLISFICILIVVAYVLKDLNMDKLLHIGADKIVKAILDYLFS